MIAPLTQGFLEAAERDIGDMERSLADSPGLAAYLAQQAVEKLARAVCIHAGLPDRRSHDILQIAERLPKENPFRKKFSGLSKLTSAATLWRYPNSEGKFPPPPDPEALRKTLNQIKTIQADVLDWIKTS